MVGLSIVLEGYHQKHVNGSNNNNTPQVINKASAMIIKPTPLLHSPSSSSSSNFQYPVFLQQCFLCKQTLLPGKDIYMYKGDRGFCSVECRCRQIFMDEEDNSNKDNCSFSAIKHKSTSSDSSSSSSSSGSASRHHGNHRKGRNRAGGFVY